MVFHQKLIFILNLGYLICNLASANDTSTLKLLQIVQRHADRTPLEFYPNDPYKNSSNWPDGFSQLSLNGKKRMFLIGTKTKQRYSNYLKYVTPRDVYARSSSAERCLESASVFTASLIQPVTDSNNRSWIWDAEKDFSSVWQPIAINTIDKTQDGLLVTTANCPAANLAWQRVMQSDKVQNYIKENRKFIDDLEKHTGDKYTRLRPLEFLSNTLRVEREFGFEMPEWVNKTMIDKLREFELHAFKFDWSTEEIQRLRCGLLIGELINNMKDYVNNKSTKKLFIYTTHDVLMITLMQALGIYEDNPPGYGGALLFELHQINDKQFIIKLYFANEIQFDQLEPELKTQELELPECNSSKQCNLDEFEKSVKRFIPNNWIEECRSNGGFSSQFNWFLFIIAKFIWFQLN